MTSTKILSIEPILVSSPYGDGNNLGQPLGLKTIGFVKVTLDNGFVGFGEAYIAIYTPELFRATVLCIQQHILHSNPTFSSPHDVYQSFYIPFASRNGLIHSVYSAVDTALWDAFCKSQHKSFSDITGLPIVVKPSIYFSGGSAKMSCDEISKESSGINNTIFNGYKIRVGYHTWPEDLERIKTAISYNTTPHFMIDAIMGTIRPSLLPTDWINRIRDIRDLNIEWLEEPLSPDNFSSVADLRCMTKTPLAFGEAVTGKYELMSYINSPHLDVLQLDFTHLGGPSLFLDVYSDIIASNKTISMHVWGSPLAFNVNSYLGSLIPNCSWTEYPSVSLGINEKLCFSYYNREPDLLAVQALIGFAPSTFGDMVFSAYPFVPGTSFSWKPK